MICKKCGNDIADDAKVCPECGEALEETVNVSKETFEETEVEMPEEISEEPAEEMSEEATEEIENEDEVYYESEENEDSFESEEPMEIKKSGFGKVISSLVVVIIVAIALFAGYNEIFGKSEEFAPFIYLRETKSGNSVCANDYNGNEMILIKDFEDGNSFSQNSNFVVGGKNIYYIDNGTLKLYTFGKKEAEVISKDVLSASVVVSADDKTVLFVKGKDDKNTLCTYRAGKKVNEITELSKVKYSTGGNPCYGFLKGTDKVWYVKIEDDTKAGELIADGKSIAKKVSGVEYISGDAKNIAYTTTDGETKKLNIIENGGKSSVLTEGDAVDKPVYYVETPAKGIIYMSDIKESSEESMQTSEGTLYYREFGKKSKAIDTEVGVYAMMRTMSERGNSSYDDGVFSDGNDVLIYMQKNEIVMSVGGTNISLPEKFSYSTANPAFSKDGNRMIYTDTDEKLVYCDLKNGKWSEPVVIAKKDANIAAVNDDADMIAYVVSSGDGADAKNALSLYSTAKKETYKLTDNTVSTPYFGKDGKTLYYTDNLNAEKGSAAINCSINGAKGTVVDKEINGFASGTAYDPIAFKLADESGQKIDIYTVKNGKLSEIAKNVINVFYY